MPEHKAVMARAQAVLRTSSDVQKDAKEKQDKSQEEHAGGYDRRGTWSGSKSWNHKDWNDNSDKKDWNSNSYKDGKGGKWKGNHNSSNSFYDRNGNKVWTNGSSHSHGSSGYSQRNGGSSGYNHETHYSSSGKRYTPGERSTNTNTNVRGPGYRTGDWWCDHCNFQNFASKTHCHMCDRHYTDCDVKEASQVPTLEDVVDLEKTETELNEAIRKQSSLLGINKSVIEKATEERVTLEAKMEEMRTARRDIVTTIREARIKASLAQADKEKLRLEKEAKESKSESKSSTDKGDAQEKSIDAEPEKKTDSPRRVFINVEEDEPVDAGTPKASETTEQENFKATFGVTQKKLTSALSIASAGKNLAEMSKKDVDNEDGATSKKEKKKKDKERSIIIKNVDDQPRAKKSDTSSSRTVKALKAAHDNILRRKTATSSPSTKKAARKAKKKAQEQEAAKTDPAKDKEVVDTSTGTIIQKGIFEGCKTIYEAQMNLLTADRRSEVESAKEKFGEDSQEFWQSIVNATNSQDEEEKVKKLIATNAEPVTPTQTSKPNKPKTAKKKKLNDSENSRKTSSDGSSVGMIPVSLSESGDSEVSPTSPDYDALEVSDDVIMNSTEDSGEANPPEAVGTTSVHNQESQDSDESGEQADVTASGVTESTPVDRVDDETLKKMNSKLDLENKDLASENKDLQDQMQKMWKMLNRMKKRDIDYVSSDDEEMTSSPSKKHKTS